MEPIEFKERNVVWAANQKGFKPLPAFTNEKETISRWKLTWGERIMLLFTGRLWHRQSNFGQPLQGISMVVTSPFIYGKK